jgi:manganese transport protein
MNLLDSSLALNLAFLVNAAILVLAATVFFKTGRTSIASIRDAYLLLGRLLGHRFAPTLFAIALIAAGQSSTLTGTLAGQIVMEGYLQLRINPVLRRLLTRLLAILPALLVILIAGESQVDNLMVFSQVVLSVQLGFAVIPLIHFVSDRKKMGSFAIGPAAQVLGWVIAVLLIYLNLKLVLDSLTGYFSEPGHLIWKLLLSTALVAGLLLLFYLLVHPWLSLRGQPDAIRIHPQTGKAFHLHAPSFEHVAIALDFSEHDEKLLAYAIGQGSRKTRFLLIHVVESVSAQLLGKESDDYETRQDEQTLQSYQAQLQQLGWESRIRLGYRHRTQEIVRIVREEHADMLVIGAHGHSGIQDFIFGETVNSVRHELQIPVLIVHL